jgi:hypothetical protein
VRMVLLARNGFSYPGVSKPLLSGFPGGGLLTDGDTRRSALRLDQRLGIASLVRRGVFR